MLAPLPFVWPLTGALLVGFGTRWGSGMELFRLTRDRQA
jgi:hypothetical protein